MSVVVPQQTLAGASQQQRRELAKAPLIASASSPAASNAFSSAMEAPDGLWLADKAALLPPALESSTIGASPAGIAARTKPEMNTSSLSVDVRLEEARAAAATALGLQDENELQVRLRPYFRPALRIALQQPGIPICRKWSRCLSLSPSFSSWPY
jgi:hypothetical protein